MCKAGPIDFTTLKRRPWPNDALVAPARVCPAAESDLAAPVVAADAMALFDRIRAIVAGTPRTRILSEDPAAGWLVAEQRTRLLRLPDRIDLAVLPAGPGRATLALYSRSRYGFGDLGVNRRRLERWLRQLAAALPSGQS